MKITMVGHSSLLVETNGKKILTDPYFSLKGNIAYRRLGKPAVNRDDLKNVDIVLLSHGHFDHIDCKFFRMLNTQAQTIGPKSLSLLLRTLGVRKVSTLGLWESKIFDNISITALPASHLAPTSGFMIGSEGLNVYFAGDTFFRPFMREIGARFKIDAALIPVTTFRIPMTMGEKGAVRAVEALNPGTVIPIHLGIEPRCPLLKTRQSVSGFAERLAQEHSDAAVRVLKNGESCII